MTGAFLARVVLTAIVVVHGTAATPSGTAVAASAIAQRDRGSIVESSALQDDADLKRLRQEAARGDRQAQFSLGLAYETGEGVGRDDEMAATWYQKAAEQGHPQAQYHLGILYVDGRGRSQDDRAAVRWFHQAAGPGAR